MFGFRSLISVSCGLALGFAVCASTGFGQVSSDDPDPLAKKVTAYSKEPGKGPQIPFDELRWEFWWYFNREPLIGLREALFDQQAGQAAVDEPFTKLKQEDRAQVLVKRLVFSLRDSNPAVRAQAVLALAKSQEPSARPGIANALEDKEFSVRLAASVATGVWHNTFFLGRLEEMLKNDGLEMQARFNAAIALGLIGGAQTAEAFRQMLSPGPFKALPPQVQAALAYAVGVARENENVPLVRALLDDRAVTDPHARAYLALALGKTGTDADLPRVYQLLSDMDAQVRRSAVIGLGVRLRGTNGAGASAEAVKQLIAISKNDDDVMTRNFAYITLGYIGGGDAVKHLRDALGRENATQQTFVALALGLTGDADSVSSLLMHFEREADQSAKGAFAIALGLMRDKKAAPALRKAFEAAGEPVLRGHIGLALGMVRDPDSVKPIVSAFAGANDLELIPNLAIALGLLGARPAVTDMIARAKKEPNEYVKQSLLYSSGLVGDASALAPLAALLDSEKEVAYVREYATAALGLLGEERPIRAIAMLTIDSNYTVRQSFLEEIFAEL